MVRPSEVRRSYAHDKTLQTHNNPPRQRSSYLIQCVCADNGTG